MTDNKSGVSHLFLLFSLQESFCWGKVFLDLGNIFWVLATQSLKEDSLIITLEDSHVVGTVVHLELGLLSDHLLSQLLQEYSILFTLTILIKQRVQSRDLIVGRLVNQLI